MRSYRKSDSRGKTRSWQICYNDMHNMIRPVEFPRTAQYTPPLLVGIFIIYTYRERQRR